MENLMEQLFSDGNSGRALQAFAPRCTIAESENDFEIQVDLPGIQPADLQVEVRGQELWLSGERKQEKEEKGKTYHRIEQEYGRFERVIPLPTPVDEGAVKAEYHNGILKVLVPKSAAVRPKRIPISSN
jgi:HSP20 family protein